MHCSGQALRHCSGQAFKRAFDAFGRLMDRLLSPFQTVAHGDVRLMYDLIEVHEVQMERDDSGQVTVRVAVTLSSPIAHGGMPVYIPDAPELLVRDRRFLVEDWTPSGDILNEFYTRGVYREDFPLEGHVLWGQRHVYEFRVPPDAAQGLVSAKISFRFRGVDRASKPFDLDFGPLRDLRQPAPPA